MLFYIFGLVVKRLLSLLTTWLMGRMNSARPVAESNDYADNSSLLISARLGLQHYLYLYLAVSVLEVVV